MATKTFDYKTASVADITKAIVSISQRGKTLQGDIQNTALACLVQVQQHGNTTPLNSLILALAESQRRNALIAWAVRFGGVELNRDTKGKSKNPVSLVDRTAVDLQGAIGLPWFKIKSEREPEAIVDAAGQVERLLKRLVKAAEEGRTTPEDAIRVRTLSKVWYGAQDENAAPQGGDQGVAGTTPAIPVPNVPVALLAAAGAAPAQVH